MSLWFHRLISQTIDIFIFNCSSMKYESQIMVYHHIKLLLYSCHYGGWKNYLYALAFQHFPQDFPETKKNLFAISNSIWLGISAIDNKIYESSRSCNHQNSNIIRHNTELIIRSLTINGTKRHHFNVAWFEFRLFLHNIKKTAIKHSYLLQT